MTFVAKDDADLEIILFFILAEESPQWISIYYEMALMSDPVFLYRTNNNMLK